MKQLIFLLTFFQIVVAGGEPSMRRSTTPLKFSNTELNLGKSAWQYFLNNRHDNGLVNATEGYPMVTMWDVGSTVAGLVAARELGLISKGDFSTWFGTLTTTLKTLSLYRGELPNKAYEIEKLNPIDYGKPETRKEVGFSAVDIGRLVRWLKLVEHLYPEHSRQATELIGSWKTKRLTNAGSLYGVSLKGKKEKWEQEGRHGYEQYAALGVERLGLNATVSRDNSANRVYVAVSGVDVPADKRTTYHNYVTSEPYILDGLESGFAALTEGDAARVLLAQEARFRQTKILTAWSEDNLNKFPWFTYNCVFVNGFPWRTLSFGGDDVTGLRSSSTKAAFAWHALFRSPYTAKLYDRFKSLHSPQRGVYAGILEEQNRVNEVVSLNTNAIVLESLFYLLRGKSFQEFGRK